MATSAQRAHMGAIMDLLVAHEPLIHYKQARPMATRRLLEHDIVARLAAKRTLSMDCSESVTLICRLAGLADPNGLHYDGSGFTGTMLGHLKHYSDPLAADVGALVVFGPGSGDHVCMVRKRGHDPLLMSHGSERGPFYIHLSDERRAHKPPVTFLSIARL